MSYASSSLSLEINNITKSASPAPLYRLSAEIYSDNRLTIESIVNTLDVVCDYEYEYGPYISLVLTIPAGDYHYDIWQNRSQLEITIINKIVSSDDKVEKLTKKRYKAVLDEEHGDISIKMGGNGSINQETLNRGKLLDVRFQLIDPCLYELSMRLIGGSFRDLTNEDLIRTILTVESNKVTVPGNEKFNGVSISSINNVDKKDHIVIPHGTKLVDIVDYLQLKGSGLYSTGAGIFFHDLKWYVYPLFDTTRVTKEKEVMDVFVVPQSVMPGTERSTVSEGGLLKIICSGDVSINDDSEKLEIGTGNGTRFTNANNMVDGFSKTDSNKTTISRPENNTEAKNTDRADKLNNAPVDSRAITSNPFVAYSRLAAKNNAYIQVVWYNSQSERLYPGMPVTVHYLENDKVVKAKGVLLKLHDFKKMREFNGRETDYTATTVLGISIERVNKK